jgi:hypothetical protein
MAAITQTIAIVDKSNKVVGTTKQLKNVFKEAKMAYMERKAEIVAERKAKEDRELHKARKHVEAMTIADDESMASSRRSTRQHRSRRHAHYESDEDDYDQPRGAISQRPSLREHRHRSSASVRSARTATSRSSFDSARRSSRSQSQSPRTKHIPLGQFNDDLAIQRSAPSSPKGHELVRRRTDGLALQQKERRPSAARSHSATDIDMDLAYGDYHPSSLGLALDPATEEKLQKQEMMTLVERAKGLLDEANCAQHSVKAIVAHLQKNPDAMAAVALTLAEISNIATKMAPAALASLKTTAPAVFALLASPQFLIAVGVGVGVTVVAIGGYKIIKKIQSGKEKEGSMDEMLEVKELDRIEHWRRGIADAGDDAYEASVVSGVSGTSVEGEFITPMAARSMGHLPPETKKDKKQREKEAKKQKEKSEKKDKKESKEKKKRSSGRSEAGSVTSAGTSASRRGTRIEGVRVADVVKKPSPLRRMFTQKDGSSTAT